MYLGWAKSKAKLLYGQNFLIENTSSVCKIKKVLKTENDALTMYYMGRKATSVVHTAARLNLKRNYNAGI